MMAMNNQQDMQETRWTEIAASVPGRSAKACRKRWVNGLNDRLKKGTWTMEEDNRLREAITLLSNDWARIAEYVGNRSGDQCSKRWREVLDPTINKASWSAEEDQLLVDLYNKYGSCWQVISTHLNNRRALQCRNRCCKLLGLHAHPRKKTASSDKPSPASLSFASSSSASPKRGFPESAFPITPIFENSLLPANTPWKKNESQDVLDLNSLFQTSELDQNNFDTTQSNDKDLINYIGQMNSVGHETNNNSEQDKANSQKRANTSLKDTHTMNFIDAWSKVHGYASSQRKGPPRALNLNLDHSFNHSLNSPTDSLFSPYLESAKSMPTGSPLPTPCLAPAPATAGLTDAFSTNLDLNGHSLMQQSLQQSMQQTMSPSVQQTLSPTLQPTVQHTIQPQMHLMQQPTHSMQQSTSVSGDTDNNLLSDSLAAITGIGLINDSKFMNSSLHHSPSSDQPTMTSTSSYQDPLSMITNKVFPFNDHDNWSANLSFETPTM